MKVLSNRDSLIFVDMTESAQLSLMRTRQLVQEYAPPCESLARIGRELYREAASHFRSVSEGDSHLGQSSAAPQEVKWEGKTLRQLAREKDDVPDIVLPQPPLVRVSLLVNGGHVEVSLCVPIQNVEIPAGLLVGIKDIPVPIPLMDKGREKKYPLPEAFLQVM